MNAVIKVSEKTKEKIIKYYEELKVDKEIAYVIFQAKDGDTTITMYESGKIMFQGVSADVDAAMWQEIDGQVPEKLKKKALEEEKYYNISSVGSDEVGTGDYFGPIVVTATYVNKKDIPKLEKLGLKDSKKISDEIILKIAPKLIKLVKYRSIVMRNQEYNERHQDHNMNKIKAILHNKVLYQLINEEKPKYEALVVDEFAKENRYYEYLKDSLNIQRGITFMQKAEDKVLSVAAASIISRYIFLKEFDKLSDELGLALPKGAGPAVDTTGEDIVEKYGKEKLGEIAKLNFNNTSRIIKNKII